MLRYPHNESDIFSLNCISFHGIELQCHVHFFVFFLLSNTKPLKVHTCHKEYTTQEIGQQFDLWIKFSSTGLRHPFNPQKGSPRRRAMVLKKVLLDSIINQTSSRGYKKCHPEFGPFPFVSKARRPSAKPLEGRGRYAGHESVFHTGCVHSQPCPTAPTAHILSAVYDTCMSEPNLHIRAPLTRNTIPCSP